MTEQLVTKETATLAKEKGFDEHTWSYYYNDELCHGVLDNSEVKWNSDSDYSSDHIWAAPTQSLLQKWLRDVHQIHISVDYFGRSDGKAGWGFEFWKMLVSTSAESPSHWENFDTYEEALEQGLLEALKLIL